MKGAIIMDFTGEKERINRLASIKPKPRAVPSLAVSMYGYRQDFAEQQEAVDYLYSKGFIRADASLNGVDYHNAWRHPKENDDATIHKMRTGGYFVCYMNPVKEKLIARQRSRRGL